MKQFSKFKHAVAAILMLASAMCVSAFEYDGFKYDIISHAERTCALVKNSKKPFTGDVIVPGTTLFNSGTPWEVEYTVTRIGDGAFASCAGLTSVTLPSTIIEIGSSAFHSCPDLISVSLPESLTEIESRAFYSCPKLMPMKLPESLTYIVSYAFAKSKNLESVTLPESVAYIGSYAFAESKNLESVTLPPKIAIVEEGTFKGCSSLKSITIPSLVEWIRRESLTSIHHVTFDKSESKLSVPDKYPSDVYIYPPLPFSSDLKKITTGRNFDTGYYKEVYSGKMVIFSGNIYGFNNVTELEVTDNALMDDFFDTCSFRSTIINLSIGKEISGFPTSLTKCTSLKRLMLADMTPPACPGFTDTQYTWTTLYVPQGALEAYRSATGWKDFRNIVGYDAGFTLPEAREYDFETGGIGYCITDVAECSVTYTDKGKIAGDIEIPSTVMYDGMELQVDSIAQEAFRDCNNMTSLTIPGSLDYLGYRAFKDCKRLRKVTFEKSERKLDFGYDMLVLGNPLYYTFEGCDAIDTLVIGREMSAVDYYDEGIFPGLGLTAAKNLIIPDGANNVNVGDIFRRLYFIKSITLGKDMTKFPTDMSECSRLESLILRDETPRPCPHFWEEQYSTVKLYVPDGSLEAYRNADGWKRFLSVSALDDTTIATPARTETGRYDLQGREVNDAYKGIVIIRYSDGTAAKTLVR